MGAGDALVGGAANVGGLFGGAAVDPDAPPLVFDAFQTLQSYAQNFQNITYFPLPTTQEEDEDEAPEEEEAGFNLGNFQELLDISM